jgi:Na+/H+ antiporter family
MGSTTESMTVFGFGCSSCHVSFHYNRRSISSWVGFEVGLINDELEKIIQYVNDNNLELTIKDSGFAIFLQSIKYRYYPIFMLVLMMILIGLQRDFGPMLLAERQVRVYDRTDGGPNKGKAGEMEGSAQNQPREDQPLLSINMLLPVLILITLIFLALVRSGDDGSGTQTFMEKIENSDSYLAMLYGVRIPFVIGAGSLIHPTLLVPFAIPTRYSFALARNHTHRPWERLGLLCSCTCAKSPSQELASCHCPRPRISMTCCLGEKIKWERNLASL